MVQLCNSRLEGFTCSLSSVSSLREAVSVSRVSPLKAGGGVGSFGVGLFTDGRRDIDEFKEDDTRGELTAERAVAPLAIELGGDVDVVEDRRREVGGVALPGRGVAVVAI